MTNAQQQARILRNMGLHKVNPNPAQRLSLEQMGVAATAEVIAKAKALKESEEEQGEGP